MGFNWNCPYCNTKTTINSGNYTQSESSMTIECKEGYKLLQNQWIVCPNRECMSTTLIATLYNYKYENNDWKKKELVNTWKLLPGSYAKVYPNYIPKALINDYQEASAILELSPKASATLSRRCLQGIIRDFWKVSKPTLFAEINAIEDKIDPLTFKSIDSVRKVGNIGAHMEKDIDLIIDVEPKEAFLLIQLIELLFEEWYIHKYERELKLKSIANIADLKDQLKIKK